MFHSSLEEATARARQSGRVVFIDANSPY